MKDKLYSVVYQTAETVFLLICHEKMIISIISRTTYYDINNHIPKVPHGDMNIEIMLGYEP